MADASELTSRWPLWFKGRLRLARALEGQGGVTAAVHSYAAALHLMDASDARGVRVVVCAGLCVCVWFASVRVCVCKCVYMPVRDYVPACKIKLLINVDLLPKDCTACSWSG